MGIMDKNQGRDNWDTNHQVMSKDLQSKGLQGNLAMEAHMEETAEALKEAVRSLLNMGENDHFLLNTGKISLQLISLLYFQP